MFSQTKEQKQRITNDYNVSRLNDLSILFKNKAKANRMEALALVKKNNWRVRYEEEGKLFELMKVSSLGTLIYYITFNVNAAKSTRANFLQNGGGLGLNLEGQNMIAHVWDSGSSADSNYHCWDDTERVGRNRPDCAGIYDIFFNNYQLLTINLKAALYFLLFK